MVDLARPNFIDRDPEVILNEAIALFEQTAERTLFPAQVERLILGLISYREALVRIAIQNAAEQNLVNYATGLNLDQLGALLVTERLPAAAAKTTIAFTLAIARPTETIIPAGTQVATQGSVTFATDAAATILAGQTTVNQVATCTQTGVIGNGYAEGTIDALLVAIDEVSASNTTVSNGGAEIEGDESLRSRIKLAPNRYSVAGSVGSYKFHTFSVSQTIVDVAVVNSSRVVVDVYPLTVTGLPSDELIIQVAAALSVDTVRPLTDIVNVYAPIQVPYAITAVIVRLTSSDPSELMDRLEIAAAAFASDRRSKLGKDITLSALTSALMLPGVYDVMITAPPATIQIAANEWANCTAFNLSFFSEPQEG